MSQIAIAGELSVKVVTSTGAPVPDVVILLKPLSRIVPDTTANPVSTEQGTPRAAEMSQEDLEFSPFVLPVKKGTTINFPNKDKVRHHVYSFSKAKRFELKLYGGDEHRAVEFDETGIVALGCNIHDDMLAYVVVTDALHFGVSDDFGSLSLKDVSGGAYTAQFWHPNLTRSSSPVEHNVQVTEESAFHLDVELPVKIKSVVSQSTRRDKVDY